MSELTEYFYIDVFPAKNGDCFMVRCYDGKTKTNILIDGGYADTYHDFLKSYLLVMKELGEQIDLLVVTHIDEDHITGIIEFIKENGECDNPSIISIKEIWFNSLRHLNIAKSDKKLTEKEKEEKSKKILEGFKNTPTTSGVNEIAGLQGSILSTLLQYYGYEKIWNKTFNHEPISIELINGKEIRNFEPLIIKLLSPNHIKLDALKTKWISHLKSNGIEENLTEFDGAYEVFIRNLDIDLPKSEVYNITSDGFGVDSLSLKDADDPSPANGSSIAFILMFKNKKILLLGDAHSKVIENELMKLQKEERNFRLIKLSHHGSNSNIGSLSTNNGFLNLVESKEFLISSDGTSYGHPNLQTIAKIVSSKKGCNSKISFNYKSNSQLKNIPIKDIEQYYKISFYLNEDKQKYYINCLE